MIILKNFVFVLVLVGVISDDEDIGEIIRSANLEFAKDLYRVISSTEEYEFVFSPLAVLYVMSLLMIGASDETVEQLSKISYLPTDNTSVQAIYKYLSKNVNNLNKAELNIANKIYYIGNAKLSNSYLNNIRELNIPVERIDDYTQIPADIHKLIINNVGENVKLAESRIDQLIANAIYFEGKWTTKMKKNSYMFRTPIFLLQDTEYLVTTEKFYYLDDKHLNCEFLELPLYNYDVVLTIVLPRLADGVYYLEEYISEVLDTKPTTLANVNVRIPIHKATHMNTDLKISLQKLGLQQAFKRKANFNKLSSVPLKVNDIVQQTMLNIDIHSAAIASGTLNGENRITRSSDDVEFIADHPFIYYFTHKVLGILFVGRLYYP